MNTLPALLFLVGVCLTQSAPQVSPPEHPQVVVPIVSQESNIYPDGQYNYSFVSGDGTSQEQKAEVKLVDDVPVLKVEGKYTYEDSEGVVHTITYTADENGYHPVGDLLPVAPPIPEAIVRSLEYNKEHPYVEEEQKP